MFNQYHGQALLWGLSYPTMFYLPASYDFIIILLLRAFLVSMGFEDPLIFLHSLRLAHDHYGRVWLSFRNEPLTPLSHIRFNSERGSS
ncbi:unnamed protein product [Phytomonas sp. EM1]|nr:unnamed protein product [Phytomonas sp. EM1]|eukprot:CCW65602.1 unnamed protein product [Phytomonas sp. isolate EM1]